MLSESTCSHTRCPPPPPPQPPAYPTHAPPPSLPRQVLEDPRWPAQFPFAPDQFERYDESSDTLFYDSPRFVTHIDDAAIAALTDFYAHSFPPPGEGVALLDICSSWICHYPPGYNAGRVAGAP